MEKIPPEKIEQLLQNFQKKAMITAQRDLDIHYNKGIEMFTKELNITNAKEEQWALLLLQLFKDLHKEEREALNFKNYYADLSRLLKPEGPTPEELAQALKEYKKILMDRADRELQMYEKKVKHMFEKVEEEYIKEQMSRLITYFPDLPLLLKPEGHTPEEHIQALKEYNKILKDRADRELQMYVKKVKHMLAKVEEENIKEKMSRFAVVPVPVDANILGLIKKVNLECEAGEVSNKLYLED